MKQMPEVHAETDRFVSGPRFVEFPECSCLDRAGYGYAGSGGFSVLLGRKGENGILAGIRCRDRECYIIVIGILRHRGVQRGCEISLCMVGPGEQGELFCLQYCAPGLVVGPDGHLVPDFPGESSCGRVQLSSGIGLRCGEGHGDRTVTPSVGFDTCTGRGNTCHGKDGHSGEY